MLWTMLLGVLVTGGLVVAVGGLQRMIVFPATKEMVWSPGDEGWTYQNVTVSVDGCTTHGWYITVPESRGTVLYSHGNGGNISDRMEGIEVWRGLGFDVLIYDYGGYGNSTGKASEQRCYKDVRTMWRWLTEEQGIPRDRILLFGRSLGGAVAADLAAEVTPGAVILESTFASAVALGKEAFPFLPVNLLLRHRFETKDKIGRISAPLLVVHSPGDDIVPYHHGEALFKMAPEPKTFLEISGSHNDGYMESGEQYLRGLRDFLGPLFPG